MSANGRPMRATSSRAQHSLARIRDLSTFRRRHPCALRDRHLLRHSSLVLTLLLVTADRRTRSAKRTPLVDALFTAVSAICVTGLSTVDMATHWSAFGNTAILIGVQIGGIGVLTLASILGLVVSRRLGLRQQASWPRATPTRSRIHVGPVTECQAVRLGEIGGLLATVAISALAIEVVLAVVLFPRLLVEGFDVVARHLAGLLLRGMAFTNTGFVPARRGLAAVRATTHGCSASIGLACSSAASASPSSSRWFATSSDGARLVGAREAHPLHHGAPDRCRGARRAGARVEQPQHHRWAESDRCDP